MIVRRVLEEFEARLEPASAAGPGRDGRGKMEYKRYGNGRQRMKIKCRGLELPDGTKLELRCGDTVIALLETHRKRAELDEERDRAAQFPIPAPGDVLELCQDGMPLLAGSVYQD